MTVMSGNTRMDAAFIHGQKPKALFLNLDALPKKGGKK